VSWDARIDLGLLPAGLLGEARVIKGAAPVEYGANAVAGVVDLGANGQLTLSSGRRTRFPTARELYGQALGRFALNPDLAPEAAWFIDAELQWEVAGFSIMANPFLIRFEDTLAQRVLADGRRQRFNLPGATTYGIDAVLRRDLTRTLRFALSATALSVRADQGTAAFRSSRRTARGRRRGRSGCRGRASTCPPLRRSHCVPRSRSRKSARGGCG
jgi:outer membrane receptor protein involved in Fe transport